MMIGTGMGLVFWTISIATVGCPRDLEPRKIRILIKSIWICHRSSFEIYLYWRYELYCEFGYRVQVEEARQVEAHECASLGLRIGYPLYDAFHESLLVLLLLLLEKAFLWVRLQLPDHRRLSSPNLWIGSARQKVHIKNFLYDEKTLQWEPC